MHCAPLPLQRTNAPPLQAQTKLPVFALVASDVQLHYECSLIVHEGRCTCNTLLPCPPPQVLLQDAVVAVAIQDGSSVDGCAVLPAGCGVPTAFEDEPDAGFAELTERVVEAVRCGGLGAAGQPLLMWEEGDWR